MAYSLGAFLTTAEHDLEDHTGLPGVLASEDLADDENIVLSQQVYN